MSDNITNDADTNAAADALAMAFDAALLADLTRALLPFLGPYSITTVKRSARTSADANALLRNVSNHIDDHAKREVFMKAAKRILSDYQDELALHQATETPAEESATAAEDNARPVSPITPELIHRGEAALAPIIGPLATVLVSRYAAGAQSSREFFERLATHLRTPEERDSFFLSVRTGNGAWRVR
jgi:hypothetical protein